MVAACSQAIQALSPKDRRGRLVLLQRAHRVADDIRAAGMEPCKQVLCALATAAGRAGQVQQALQICRELQVPPPHPRPAPALSLSLLPNSWEALAYMLVVQCAWRACCGLSNVLSAPRSVFGSSQCKCRLHTTAVILVVPSLTHCLLLTPAHRAVRPWQFD